MTVNCKRIGNTFAAEVHGLDLCRRITPWYATRKKTEGAGRTCPSNVIMFALAQPAQSFRRFKFEQFDEFQHCGRCPAIRTALNSLPTQSWVQHAHRFESFSVRVVTRVIPLSSLLASWHAGVSALDIPQGHQHFGCAAIKFSSLTCNTRPISFHRPAILCNCRRPYHRGR